MADDLEKAREALNRQWDKQIGGLFGQAKSITSAVEAFVNAILSSREEKAGAAGLVEARSEIEQAKKYATMLFASLAPHCQPMGDLIGILTQIDNATTVIPTLNARIAELERERDEARQKRDEHFAEVKRAQAIIDDLKLWRQSIYNQSINADRIAMLLSEHPEPDSRSFVAVQIAEQCDKAIANARCFADDRAEKAEAALAELRGRVLEIANGLEGFTHLGASKIHYLQRELRALLSPEGEAKDEGTNQKGGDPDRADVPRKADERGDIAQPARDSDPVPAMDQREAAIQRLIGVLRGVQKLPNIGRLTQSLINEALAATRPAGLTGGSGDV